VVIGGHEGAILRDVRTLLAAGTHAGLTDQQLLDRFRAGGATAEPAFAAIVQRHGPMVVRVCRATLGGSHDLEDAFQATFLVLVRRADSLWVRDSLGPWLHGVACRVARHCRKIAARRATHERRAAREASLYDFGSVDFLDGPDEARLLHEELGGLPQRFRAPLVLCYLEGMTHEQAAEQLRCPIGTVRSRLARGRDHLRKRLVRRGLTSEAGWMSIQSAIPPAQAAISARLTETTVTAACTVAGGLSPQAASFTALNLTEGVCMTMSMIRSKMLAAGLMVLAVVGTGVAVVARQDGPTAKSEIRDDGASDKAETHSSQGATIEWTGKAPPRLHEISVPPGSTVRIEVETKDKKVISCNAVFHDDGHFELSQQTRDPASKYLLSEIGLRSAGILITPSSPARRTVTKQWLETAPDKGDTKSKDEPAPNKAETKAKDEWYETTPEKGVAKGKGYFYKAAPEKGFMEAKKSYFYEAVPEKGASARWWREPAPSSDHERRLRELESKLDRVLRLLERQPGVQDLHEFDFEKKAP
jgi:RNA polymerase sigma factor (sigma-70 family)